MHTMRQGTDNWVDRIWYGGSRLSLLLLPLSVIYGMAIRARRFLYVTRILRTVNTLLPVIVIGNITAGGTGKTPLTIWLAQTLRSRGYAAGIVTRGYRGNVGPVPVLATPDSDPGIVGDEAILLAQKSACPVVVHPDRVAAARKLESLDVDVVISDDGLQHLRLGRDFEILVIDYSRGFGNGRLLPAGPLRETTARVGSVDEVFVQREPAQQAGDFARVENPAPRYFHLEAACAKRLGGERAVLLAEFAGKTVHAVAGIGHPERFFRLLESHGIDVIRHPKPDHAVLLQNDLEFDDDYPVIMTEKDVVKCRHLECKDCWYVPVDAVIDARDRDALLRSILGKLNRRITANS